MGERQLVTGSADDVLRIEEGVITEIVVFMPDVFPAFGLPLTMEGPSPRKSFDSSERANE